MQAPCGTRPAGRWNRNGLVVGTFFTKAIDTAEREAAIAMIEGLPDDGRITLRPRFESHEAGSRLRFG